MRNQPREKKKAGRPHKNTTGLPAKKAAFSLSDRHRFALRWIAAQDSDAKDQTLILEELIKERADAVSKRDGKHWLEFYSDEESVRTLNLLGQPFFRATTQEERIRQFVFAHAPFFYLDAENTRPNPVSAVILWDRLWEWIELWETKRSEDYWCAAKLMAAALKKHGEKVPKGRWL